VIGDDRRGEKSRELKPAVAVRGDQHGDLDALVAQSSDAPGPFSFDRSSPFELQAQLGEKEMTSSRDSTTMPTLSIRLRLISFLSFLTGNLRHLPFTRLGSKAYFFAVCHIYLVYMPFLRLYILI